MKLFDIRRYALIDQFNQAAERAHHQSIGKYRYNDTSGGRNEGFKKWDGGLFLGAVYNARSTYLETLDRMGDESFRNKLTQAYTTCIRFLSLTTVHSEAQAEIYHQAVLMGANSVIEALEKYPSLDIAEYECGLEHVAKNKSGYFQQAPVGGGIITPAFSSAKAESLARALKTKLARMAALKLEAA